MHSSVITYGMVLHLQVISVERMNIVYHHFSLFAIPYPLQTCVILQQIYPMYLYFLRQLCYIL